MNRSLSTVAAVLRTADGPFTIEEVDLDGPADDEAVVRVAGVGFCHTDVLPRTPVVRPPVIAGHEGAGVVESVGSAVTGLAPGDHVVLSFDSCGTCDSCLAARPAYCHTFWPRNMSGFRAGRPTNIRDSAGAPVQGRWFRQSSFATRAVVPARNAIKVDPDLPLEILGPLSCGVLTGAGSVFTSLAVAPGSSIAVFGAGAVGLSAVMAAKVAGAATIVAVDVLPERLALAEDLGATHVLDGRGGEVARRVREIAPTGMDRALDTTGVPEVSSTAIDVLAVGGVCGLVGTPRGDLTIRPEQLGVGRSIVGILVGDAVPQRLIPRLIELWRQGRFPFDRLITTYPLSKINEAEHDMLSGATVKPVLLPMEETR